MKKCFCVLLFVPLYMFSQQQSSDKSLFSSRMHLAGNIIKTSFKTIPSDFAYMGKNVTEDWKKTALYTGIIGALMVVDKPVTMFYQDEIETRVDYKLPDISIYNNDFPWTSGNDAYLFYAMSGTYLGSLFTGYERGQYAAINGFKALGYSILISHTILKTIFGRKRPYSNLSGDNSNASNEATDNPFDFFNSREGEYIFSGPHGTAMPSLHATAFFAMAKVFQMEFDNYWIPYSFAGIVFFADIKGHQHWVSDMVAGGIVGTIIGRSIVRSSWRARGILPNKEKEITFNCIPSISSQYSGFRLTATF
ncbi:phosphatase PAP2 family protein [Wenyingzhuangia sp. 2_MG-2023]|uniref:phosphatase PAP2 family protein n=1 Tax=Wenyingzhuangia sp. 2_MG-2023 TaxID=3062639 RepID=UPI0026E3DEFF|nr:phosphatase PAP2 family protein [Wenyingzhuangia sp. 2_MG-2023]MDO6738508.1 phosphatase PAP2 family protein [Wenyingzhuangia sp. 2_MG-2023]